ncbi:MAG: hypothetical protein WC243_04670 [Patescibacteria group bacterium]|jgi:DNA-binding MarR family transcriptional regulator
MVQDLRLQDTFFVNKDIYLNSNVSRKARAVYVTLSFLLTLSREKFNLDNLAKASGYNPRIVSNALRELKELGFIKRTRSSIEILK